MTQLDARKLEILRKMGVDVWSFRDPPKIPKSESESAASVQTEAVQSKSDEYVSVISEVSSRFLLIAGKPIGEPIERAGPFVMNTKAEIQQAFHVYRSGQFA